jgi:hypothetical protein
VTGASFSHAEGSLSLFDEALRLGRLSLSLGRWPKAVRRRAEEDATGDHLL